MNIAKIAELAGVSAATVSRFLNDGYVSEEKRARVQQIITETGYVPSVSAQSLRGEKNNLIGVIVPKLSSESMSRVVDGITDGLSDTKFNIMLGNTGGSVEKELEFLNIFRNNNVDGVIFIASVLTRKHNEILSSYDKPFVIVGQCDSKYPCLYHDDYTAAYEATKHLIKRGCHNIACLAVSQKDKAAGKDRTSGYQQALTDFGLKFNQEMVEECELKIESGYKNMELLFGEKLMIDGVFCATDNLAVGAMKSIRNHGFEIPSDIKVIGIGDSKISDMISPSLTSIHFYYKTCGIEAGKLLAEMIESGNKANKQIKLGFQLMSRESTALGM